MPECHVSEKMRKIVILCFVCQISYLWSRKSVHKKISLNELFHSSVNTRTQWNWFMILVKLIPVVLLLRPSLLLVVKHSKALTTNYVLQNYITRAFECLTNYLEMNIFPLFTFHVNDKRLTILIQFLFQYKVSIFISSYWKMISLIYM